MLIYELYMPTPKISELKNISDALDRREKDLSVREIVLREEERKVADMKHILEEKFKAYHIAVPTNK